MYLVSWCKKIRIVKHIKTKKIYVTLVWVIYIYPICHKDIPCQFKKYLVAHMRKRFSEFFW